MFDRASSVVWSRSTSLRRDVVCAARVPAPKRWMISSGGTTLPRLLDIGQCNDAFSAIKIATALAEAFQCDVNQLPLSLVLSWFEQKAVAVLLTLLHLGIKNIRLGPSLPAFVSPNVLKVLVEKFNIMPITTVEADLKNCLAKK